MSKETQEVSYWDQRWRDGQTGWDLGGNHPLLSDLYARARAAGLPDDGRIYIPGCGRAHDALWLAARGHQVVAADFSPTAIDSAKKNLSAVVDAGKVLAPIAARIEFVVEDATQCNKDSREYFDAVFDRAMYCALRPDLRTAYVEGVAWRLQSSGLFLSLPFHKIAISPERPFGSGPPFAVDIEEMTERLAPWFKLLLVEARTNGATDQRIKEELLTLWQKI